ncbi:30S ribosomal protein S13 [uncultured archaeon]|nr:30S ribosomal protein S13 [uncultured archaeon]
MAEEKKKQHFNPNAKQAVVVDRGENFRGIIRILGRDLKGEVRLKRALPRIKGLGENLSKVVIRIIQSKLNIDPNVEVGLLSEDQVLQIEELLRDLPKYGIPVFMLNRRMDKDSGKNIHVLTNDLIYLNKQDIDAERTLRTYRGWRHSLGQRVRGQRNRTTGRKGLTVGVMKKLAGRGSAPGAPAADAKDTKK